jgi:hypothetical protein
MNPIRSVVEIRFGEPSRRYDFISGVARALGSQVPPTPLGQRLRVQPRGRRVSINVEATRFWINVEEELKAKEFETIVLDYMVKLQENLQWGKLSRIGYRMMWVKAAEDFEQLAKVSKQKLFQDNPIISSAIDVALPLTLADGNRKINFIYGPMKKEELTSNHGFEFDVTAQPDVFAFIDIDYYSSEKQNFSPRQVRAFLESGYRFSIRTMEDFLLTLGV